MDVTSVGIMKEIRRVSDPDRAQIIWDGIKVRTGATAVSRVEVITATFADCEGAEADPGAAPTLALHESELQDRQGHHAAHARPRRRGQPGEAAQKGWD